MHSSEYNGIEMYVRAWIPDVVLIALVSKIILLVLLSNFAQCTLPCASLNPVARIPWAPSTAQKKVTLIEWHQVFRPFVSSIIVKMCLSENNKVGPFVCTLVLNSSCSKLARTSSTSIYSVLYHQCTGFSGTYSACSSLDQGKILLLFKSQINQVITLRISKTLVYIHTCMKQHRYLVSK